MFKSLYFISKISKVFINPGLAFIADTVNTSNISMQFAAVQFANTLSNCLNISFTAQPLKTLSKDSTLCINL